MRIRAVLFDVGGPIDTEEQAERQIDAAIRRNLAAEGIVVSDAEFEAANRWAVESFAPATYLAIIWRLCGGREDVARRVYAAGYGSRIFEVREGMPELLHDLQRRGVLLGLAANQPVRILEELDRWGVGECFRHREVSGHHGVHKPDVRLFLRCCESLGVLPEECVMVGDRVDNDIFPARLLGMRTVLFRTGRHIEQQPRSWDEVPDHEVWSVDELRRALEQEIPGS